MSNSPDYAQLADDPNTIQMPEVDISGHTEDEFEQLTHSPEADQLQEAGNTVQAHVLGEMVDSNPVGIALHTATMKSDRNEDADRRIGFETQSHNVDADLDWENQQRMDQQRDEQNEQHLLDLANIAAPSSEGQAWHEQEGDQQPYAEPFQP